MFICPKLKIDCYSFLWVFQPEELEEGEIAVSGDSHMDLQQSGSWLHDHDDGEDDQQVLQPKIKRKRSIRIRPRYTADKNDDPSNSEKVFAQCSSRVPLQVDEEYGVRSRTGKPEAFADSGAAKHDTNSSSLKYKPNAPARKLPSMQKSSRLSYFSGSAEDCKEYSRESWSSRANRSGGANFVDVKMSEITQRKVAILFCPNYLAVAILCQHKTIMLRCLRGSTYY